MEIMSLVTAVVTGLVVGVLGWFLMPDDRTRVVWWAGMAGLARVTRRRSASSGSRGTT
jgi:hypothetical protein